MSFLTGKEASQKITLLSLKLHKKIQGSLPAYSPWLELIHRGSIHIEPLYPALYNFLLTDTVFLDSLRKLEILNDKASSAQTRTGFSFEEVGLYRTLNKSDFKEFHLKLLKYSFNECIWIDEIWSALVKQLIPLRLKDKRQKQRSSGSYIGAKGAIFIHIPEKYNNITLAECAVDLWHEIGHQVLFIYQSVDPLFLTPKRTKVFSGVRRIYRTQYQALHAAIALYYMILGINTIKTQSIDEDVESFLKNERNKCVQQLEETLSSLKVNCEFTQTGQCIINDIGNLPKESA